MTLEKWVRLNPDIDVQIAAGPAVVAQFAFAGDPDALSVADAGRDANYQNAVLPLVPASPTLLARRRDQDPPSATGRASGHDPSEQHAETSALLDLAISAAGWAVPLRGARFATTAGTLLAEVLAIELDRFLGAGGDLFQRQRHLSL